jgi:hypothetical protein
MPSAPALSTTAYLNTLLLCVRRIAGDTDSSILLVTHMDCSHCVSAGWFGTAAGARHSLSWTVGLILLMLEVVMVAMRRGEISPLAPATLALAELRFAPSDRGDIMSDGGWNSSSLLRGW